MSLFAALLLFISKNSGLVKGIVVCVCVAKGGATHMTTLEDLYYGNISPHERDIKRGTRVDKLVKLICKNEDELNAGLMERQKETFSFLSYLFSGKVVRESQRKVKSEKIIVKSTKRKSRLRDFSFWLHRKDPKRATFRVIF